MRVLSSTLCLIRDSMIHSVSHSLPVSLYKKVLLTLRPQSKPMIMDTSKDYYESVMRDFGMYARGRSLEQYCRDEAVDYRWLTKAAGQFGTPADDRKARQGKRVATGPSKAPDMIRLHYDPEKEEAVTTKDSADGNISGGDTRTDRPERGWSVLSMVIKSPSGHEIELGASKVSAVSELLLKLEDHA